MKVFIGRKREINQIQSFLSDLFDYKGRMVIIQGDAGIGKTRLLDEFFTKIDIKNIYYLKVKVLPDDIRSYAPFLDFLDLHFESFQYRSNWLVKIIQSEWASLFCEVLPKLNQFYPFESIKYSKSGKMDTLFPHAFFSVIENISKYKPVVIFFDDISLMKVCSLNVLKYLSIRLEDKPILILGTSRSPNKSTEFIKLVDFLSERQVLSIINLTNLERSEVNKLINKQFSLISKQDFNHWLFETTKGNPLFIWEIIYSLIRLNIIRFSKKSENWTILDDYKDFPISQTIDSLIEYKFHHLNKTALKIIKVASIIGEKFDIFFLLNILPKMTKKEFLDTLHLLYVEKIFIKKDDIIEFYHPLIREVTYRKIKLYEKIKIHRKIAKYLKKNKNQYNEQIVYHQSKYLQPDEYSEELCYILINTSDNLVMKPNILLAMEFLKKAKKITEKLPTKLKKEKLLIEAKIYFIRWILGKDVFSIEEFEKYVKQIEKYGYKNETSKFYRFLYLRSISALNLDKASIFLEKGFLNSDPSESIYWIMKVDRCMLLRRRGNFKKAEEEAKSLINIIDPKISPQALYNLYQQLFILNHAKGNLIKANKYITESLKITKDYNLHLNTVDAQMNKCICEVEIGKLDDAIKKLIKIVKEEEIEQRIPHYVVRSITLAQCLIFKGEYEKALNYLYESLEKSEEINYNRMKIIAILSISDILLELKRIEEAIKLFKSLNSNNMDKEIQCHYYLLNSKICMFNGKFKEASKYLKTSLIIAKDINLNIVEGKILNLMAILNLKVKNKMLAHKNFEKSKKIFTNNQAIPHLANLLTDYGLELGSKKGESYLLEGVKLLFEMNAILRIENINKEIEGKDYKKVNEYINKILKNAIYEKTKIYTFGGLNVQKHNELYPVSHKKWQSFKARELLGLILSFSDRMKITREKLTSFLWPEMDREHAGQNFRFTLNRLCHVIGDECIIRDGQFVYLNREKIWSDLWDFEDQYRNFLSFKRQRKLHLAEKKAQKARDLYRGDFLPEFYNIIIDDKQITLKEKSKEILYWLSTRAIERMEWDEAINIARQLLSVDSCDEKGHSLIVEGLRIKGDKTGAIRQYEKYKKILKIEFDLTPSREITKIYNRIKMVLKD